MLTSLALIFLVGLTMAGICSKIKLPRIIGMLVTGIVLGPYVLNFLDSKILGISSELRSLALIIILIKAGLSLNIADLKKVGRPALMMSFVPACFEILGYTLLAPLFLGVTRGEAALMGSVLAAVSPAVVVPRMVKLMDEKYGTEKSIPQMILAGASLDDVFVIVLFSTFCGMAQGGEASLMNFVNIPVSIALGILVGALFGVILTGIFEFAHNSGNSIRNSLKVIIILGVSLVLYSLEKGLDGIIAISGLLAVMGMSTVINMKCRKDMTADLSVKYGKLWLAAEVILFVLVGAAVDIRYTMQAGLSAIALILTVLVIRSIGVWLCLLGTALNTKERIFCVISYLPKATVQAAIGSVPLSLGLGCGNIILSVAVLAILITAPLGAFGMDSTYRKFLKHETG
ncbi:MAG: cation:proton antiporter [Clostridia bacterium]|nr:cation:proton antiporter [Clostridia bacterium]